MTKITTARAFETLAGAINADPEYAWSWHCNIAMPIKDEMNCSHYSANVAAARIMRTLFSVDMFKHPYFPAD